MTIQPAGRGPQLIGICSCFIVLTTLTVVLRIYCRAFLVKKFGLDDWLAVGAWVSFAFGGAFVIRGTFHGSGQHTNDIHPPSEIPIGLKWWWAGEPVYVLANMAIKASIAVMLLRITVVRAHEIVIWIVLVLTEIDGAFYLFLLLLQCRPTSYFWTRYTGARGSCINPRITVNATYAYSAITCAGDWTFAILPFFLVWKLQMNPRTKAVVALILAMGAIASTATIIRIPYLSNLTNQADFLYATTDVAIWSACETGLGITAASMSTLRPLFRTFLSHRQFFGGSSSTAGADAAAAAAHRRLTPSRRVAAGGDEHISRRSYSVRGQNTSIAAATTTSEYAEEIEEHALTDDTSMDKSAGFVELPLEGYEEYHHHSKV